jgi:predicted N-formylglutamate amidohydrolase
LNRNDPVLQAAAGRQWPDPVEALNEHGRSPIVLVCEHASNHIPAEYGDLGLPSAELTRHIAWDIGAADVTRSLSQSLDAAAFLATYSRLLIDLNRPLTGLASIPVRSESTDIPGNRMLTQAERARRSQRIFAPFQERLAAHFDRRERAGRRSVLVAIHSFTPVYLGRSRPWHAGVLFGKSAELAQRIMTRLRSDLTLKVDANVPYGVSRDDDYALLVHGDDRGNPSVLIEIRHDLIASPEGVEDWSERLTAALAPEAT